MSQPNKTNRNKNVLELILDYHKADGDPLAAITDLLHDFNENMSDFERGRIAFDDKKDWYDAYRILCYMAYVIPESYQAILTGEYAIDEHLGHISEHLPEKWARFNQK